MQYEPSCACGITEHNRSDVFRLRDQSTWLSKSVTIFAAALLVNVASAGSPQSNGAENSWPELPSLYVSPIGDVSGEISRELERLAADRKPGPLPENVLRRFETGSLEENLTLLHTLDFTIVEQRSPRGGASDDLGPEDRVIHAEKTIDAGVTKYQEDGKKRFGVWRVWINIKVTISASGPKSVSGHILADVIDLR